MNYLTNINNLCLRLLLLNQDERTFTLNNNSIFAEVCRFVVVAFAIGNFVDIVCINSTAEYLNCGCRGAGALTFVCRRLKWNLER